jgi:PilX N-terminal
LCIIFMTVFLALGASLVTMSGTNVQLSANQRRSARAFAGAESGLEVVRYWLTYVMMESTTPPGDYLSTIVGQVQNMLEDEGVTNVVLGDGGALPAVSLNSTSGQSFSAQLSMNASDPSILDVTVTGVCQGMERTICVGFNIAPYQHPIFKYGLATKGPIQFPNNPTTTTVTSNWEADIYTESSSSMIAVQVGGNTNFAGDINIANPSATVDFAGAVTIGGDTGQDAIDNHVSIGVEPVDFPAADTSRFAPYATGPTVDPTTMDLTKGLTLTNATIPAGTNPVFDGTVNIEGVLLVEQPNVVTFNRNVELRGIMVGENGVYSASGNQINIAGNFASLPLPSDSQFDALRQEEGTSIIVPDFAVSFTGNYSAIEGVVAAGTLHFSGNASAVIKGSLISFSDEPTVVEGNVSLTFDRANTVEIPAGFDTKRILAYSPTSYAMVH